MNNVQDYLIKGIEGDNSLLKDTPDIPLPVSVKIKFSLG